MESCSNYPSVAVIIPARNAVDGLRTALPAILAQEYAGRIEVFVADGSDNNETVELVRQQYPSIHLVPNPRRTISEGINRAMRVSTSEVIVRCDAYAVLPPGYIRHAVKTLIRTGAANVGGRQCTTGGSFVTRATAIAQSIPLGVGDAHYRLGGSDGPTDTVYLGVFRRKTLEAVGRFDPTLLRNEDYALNWQIRRTGGVIWYDSALVVNYYPRDSIRALSRQYFDYGRWKSVVAWRYPKSLRARHVAAPLMIVGLIASAVGALVGAPLWAAVFPLTYLFTLLGEAVLLGIRNREPATAFLPLVLVVMHLSWGVGFFCPPREIWKKRSIPIRHPFSEERTARLWKFSFPEHEGGEPASPMIGQTHARGQRSVVASGGASVAKAGQGVSAVILTWNSVGKIELCLKSLGQGRQVPDEIIIVDNGSTDHTRTVLARQFLSAQVIANTYNRGVAQARNQGLAAAHGEYLLVMDDDTIIDSDALAQLVSVLAADPTVGLCGPQLLDLACQPIPVNLTFPTLWQKVQRWGESGPQNGGVPGNGPSGGMQDETDYAVGACQLIRRAALEEIGWYDEHIFYGPEDIDFCLRLKQAGWRVVCQPAARVIHAEQRIARSVWSAIGRKHAAGLVYYFWKHHYGLSRKRLYAHLPTNSPASRSH